MAWIRSHKKSSGGGGDFVKIYFGELVPNTWISSNDGKQYSEGNWSSTDYLEVIGGEPLVVMNNGGDSQYNAFYDENKDYISGFNTNGKPVTVPQNAKYIRMSNASYLISADMYYLVPTV